MSKNLRNNKRGIRKSTLLLTGLSIFGVSLATSVTATYAWFTISATHHLNNLNIIIKSDPTLMLGLEDAEGRPSYDDNEFTNSDLNSGDVTLKDVSGMYSSVWQNEQTVRRTPTFRAAYRGSGNHRESRVAEDGYVQKVFYLLGSEDMDIYLAGDDDASYVRPNNPANQEISAQMSTNEEEFDRTVEELDRVVDAARVSFCTDTSYVVAAPGAYQRTLYGGVLDLNGDGYYDYNAENEEILYGEYVDHSIRYNENMEESDPLKVSCFEANHKPGVEMVDIEDSNQHIAVENAIPFDALTLSKEDYNLHVKDQYGFEKTPICHIKANEDTRLVISIYLEGWDRRMTDKLYSAAFDIKLNFTGLVTD